MGYTRLSEEAKVQGFVTAMGRVEHEPAHGSGKQALTPEQFLLLHDDEAC